MTGTGEVAPDDGSSAARRGSTGTVTGRLVVVTGAGNGIGAALAAEAARRDAAAVAVADIDVDAAEQVASDIRSGGAHAVGVHCDVTDAQALDRLAGEMCTSYGSPGLVCANAGVAAAGGPLLEGEPRDARWVLEVNFFGVLTTLRSFGRSMAAAHEPGWLLATGSEHSLGLPHAGAGAYTASKHAVLGLCEVMRAELPGHVGISVLCPGLTSSRLWASGSSRPSEFGGPTEPQPISQAVIERGMAAEVVAQRALDGVAAGHFVIPTHYNARDYADARADEVAAAFDRLAAHDTSSWDVGEVAAAVLGELAVSNEDSNGGR